MASFIQMGSTALWNLVQKVQIGAHNGVPSPHIMLRLRKPMGAP